MDDQNKNLILATVLSFVVILVWFVVFPPPEPATDPNATNLESVQDGSATASLTPQAEAPAGATAPAVDLSQPQEEGARIDIDTPRIAGSIALTGARIDDIQLKDYLATQDTDAEKVTVMRPTGVANPFYAFYGWVPVSGVEPSAVPGDDTPWTAAAGQTLTIDSPVTLTWDNGAGLMFTRQIAVDQDYMFTVTQSVRNTTQSAVALRPYGVLRRHGEPTDLKSFFILHEGMIRMSDENLQEESYDNLTDFDIDPRERANADRIEVANSGWIGFTDHYWMSILIPDQGTPFRSTAKYYASADIYQTDAVLPVTEVAAGDSVTISTRLFAGAKEWETIRKYENQENVPGFLDAIDWGWFFFLTKPIFAVLHWLNSFIGNMGWSIIALTILLKALLFPLAYKSYASMAKMRELQPEMEKLRERAGDDRQKLQKEMMELYKKEKVNPASGCLPILLQIPIFFSLYKVIFVTLELRHAPWVGWIRDLSAPDPSSILNLFGLLPYATPGPESFLAIISLGVLPILLGVSMWLQQKLNPAPADPTQQMIFAWMPWVFMFMLGTFASGLVLYWITNNTITFIQQYAIMRSHGFKPDVFGNIRKSFSRRKAADEKK